MYQQGSSACKRRRTAPAWRMQSCSARAVCYTARHAANEEVDQEPQQGQEASPETQAGPPQEEPAPRHAGAL